MTREKQVFDLREKLIAARKSKDIDQIKLCINKLKEINPLDFVSMDFYKNKSWKCIPKS